jgi:hypothetical protein
VVVANRDDTAVRIGCRPVANAIARSRSDPEPEDGGGAVVVVEPEGREVGDLVALEALRVARELGWHAVREGDGDQLSGDGEAARVASRLIERLRVVVVCGFGADAAQARAALARARAVGALDVPYSP